MSATIYRWIVVYEDGDTEEKYGESPADFADYLNRVPVAIIRMTRRESFFGIG